MRPTARSVTPFLMYQRGDAGTALHFYADVFAHTEIGETKRFGPEGPGAEGSIHTAWSTICGRRLRLFDSPTPHGFDFTPSLSLFVEFEDEAEHERAYERLLDGFGVSWQLDLG